MKLMNYDRKKATQYAKKWALGRNPAYHDYENYGGDCTNFISQCLHIGGIPFDVNGRESTQKWYWYSDQSRSPSWTAARPLKNYLLNNNGMRTKHYGVYAKVCEYGELELGDLVQKTIDGKITHTMIVTGFVYDKNGQLIDYLVCQHSDDLLDFPLSQKDGILSFIKIVGYYS